MTTELIILLVIIKYYLIIYLDKYYEYMNYNDLSTNFINQ